MIRNLRNSGVGQIFLGAIVVAIILAFVLTGTGSSAGLSSDECAVEVGNDCVSPKEFFAAYGLLSAIGPGGINEAAASRFRLREQVARGLAERAVLLDEARDLGISTSEDDVDEELVHGRTRVSLPADDQIRLAASLGMCVPGPGGCEPGTIGLRSIEVTKDGQFDFEVYKRSVRVWTKRSLNHFKDMQVLEHTAERIRELVRSQVRVSPEEAFLAFSRLRSQATARTVSLSTEWFQRYLTKPSEEELSQWKASHADKLEAEVTATKDNFPVGCAIVSEILVKNSDPSSDEAEDAKKQAEKLRAQAASGKDFSELARLQSDAPSASFGGRVGCIGETYGAGSTVLQEATSELKRAGQVSPVVESIRGYHVLRLSDRVTEENQSELVEEFALRRLAEKDLAKERAREFGKKLIELSGEKTLEEALNQLLSSAFSDEDHPALQAKGHPQVEISRAITIEQEPFEGALGDLHSGVALFELEEEDDLVAEPIPTDSGFAVMQLKSKDMLTVEEFEEDRENVMAALRARKAQQALADYVSDLIEQAGGAKMNEKFVPPPEEQESEKEKDS